MKANDFGILIGWLAASLIFVIVLNAVCASYRDNKSLENIQNCHNPKFVSIQTLKYGTKLYHYQCSDGRYIDSTIPIN